MSEIKTCAQCHFLQTDSQYTESCGMLPQFKERYRCFAEPEKPLRNPGDMVCRHYPFHSMTIEAVVKDETDVSMILWPADDIKDTDTIILDEDEDDYGLALDD